MCMCLCLYVYNVFICVYVHVCVCMYVYVCVFVWPLSRHTDSDRWQLIVLLLMLLCCGIYKSFDFTESYFTIHSFFAPKIADMIKGFFTTNFVNKILKFS